MPHNKGSQCPCSQDVRLVEGCLLTDCLLLLCVQVIKHYESESEVALSQLCLTLCDPMDCSLPGSSVHGTFSGKSTGVGCHFLLKGIFPTHGSNPGLPHWKKILYQLSHKGSQRILEWVAIPSPGDLLYPEVEPRFPTLQADSLLLEPPGKF